MVEVEMHKILASQVKKCGAFPVIINGTGSHVHLLVDFGPYTSRAGLLQALKQNSSIWARRSGKFPNWEGWSKEYYCYSVSADRKDAVINYIKNQKTHHTTVNFDDEMIIMAKMAGKNLGETLEQQ